MEQSLNLTNGWIEAGGMQDPSSKLLTSIVGMSSAQMQQAHTPLLAPGFTKLVKSPPSTVLLQSPRKSMAVIVSNEAEASTDGFHAGCHNVDDADHNITAHKEAGCPDYLVPTKESLLTSAQPFETGSGQSSDELSSAIDGSTVTRLASFYATHNPSLVPEAQQIALRYNSTQQLQAALLDRYGAGLGSVKASSMPTGGASSLVQMPRQGLTSIFGELCQAVTVKILALCRCRCIAATRPRFALKEGPYTRLLVLVLLETKQQNLTLRCASQKSAKIDEAPRLKLIIQELQVRLQGGGGGGGGKVYSESYTLKNAGTKSSDSASRVCCLQAGSNSV